MSTATARMSITEVTVSLGIAGSENCGIAWTVTSVAAGFLDVGKGPALARAERDTPLSDLGFEAQAAQQILIARIGAQGFKGGLHVQKDQITGALFAGSVKRLEGIIEILERDMNKCRMDGRNVVLLGEFAQFRQLSFRGFSAASQSMGDAHEHDRGHLSAGALVGLLK